jgi:enoyl-CoA hydratase
MPDILLVEKRGEIARLTLNRPEKLNALNYALIDALLAALDRFETDPSVRAIILTGAGRAFSAGGDIPEFSESVARGPEEALQKFLARGQRLTARIEGYAKPLIAAVNGLAYGGGARSPRPRPCRSLGRRRALPSQRSCSACRQPSGERSACRVLPGASARCNFF